METINIKIERADVYGEVAKATDYTGSKLMDSDETARDRILATDEDMETLSRFWDESVLSVNESLKEMLVNGASKTDDKGSTAYVAEIEVSKSFDKKLTASVESTLRSYFIAFIIGEWFKFANKSESADYFAQAVELITAAERLLYSRRKPTLPTD